jgi:hypothetical protein
MVFNAKVHFSKKIAVHLLPCGSTSAVGHCSKEKDTITEKR